MFRFVASNRNTLESWEGLGRRHSEQRLRAPESRHGVGVKAMYKMLGIWAHVCFFGVVCDFDHKQRFLVRKGIHDVSNGFSNGTNGAIASGLFIDGQV